MDARSLALLQRFYKAYSDVVNLSNKAQPPSRLVASLDVKSNARHRWLRESAFSSDDIDNVALDDLLEAKLVAEIDEPRKYAINLRGVWLIETSEGRLTADQLISYLDTKNLEFIYHVGPLSDKDRVIVLGLIAVRAFSIDSPIDMYSSDRSKVAFARVLREAVDRVSSLGLLHDLTPKNLFRSRANEDPLSDLLRHAYDLGQKTRGVYRISKPQRYYLNLYEAQEFDQENLKHLFERVFESRTKITAEQADMLATWCDAKAFGDGLEIFDQSKHIFGSAEYGERVRTALRNAVVGSRV